MFLIWISYLWFLLSYLKHHFPAFNFCSWNLYLYFWFQLYYFNYSIIWFQKLFIGAQKVWSFFLEISFLGQFLFSFTFSMAEICIFGHKFFHLLINFAVFISFHNLTVNTIKIIVTIKIIIVIVIIYSLLWELIVHYNIAIIYYHYFN